MRAARQPPHPQARGAFAQGTGIPPVPLPLALGNEAKGSHPLGSLYLDIIDRGAMGSLPPEQAFLVGKEQPKRQAFHQMFSQEKEASC